MPTCIEYHEERTQECDDWEDQGYNDCSSWNPWLAWLCIAWTWISHVVCVSWTWLTTSVCVAWDIIVTGIGALVVTLGGIGFGWLLNFAAAVIEFIFLIPIIGPFLQWVWNTVLTVVWFLLNIPDILGYAVGIRPQKKLRVCAILFADQAGVPVAAESDVIDALNVAIDTYFREMNVIIIRDAPFQYSTGFLHPPAADPSWITVRQMSGDQLTACCNACMAGEELWLKGSSRRIEYMQDCFWGNFRRLVGLGAPVVIFVLLNMESRIVTLANGTQIPSQTVGCALSLLTDFITVAATAPALGITNSLQFAPDTTAHELGHICNLWHLKGANDVTNLMFANEDGLLNGGRALVRIGTDLFGWQCQLIRSSRHVSYF